MIGVTLFIIAVVVIFIWVAVEIKRMKHKIFAVILIGMILLAYVSFVVVFKDQDVDFTSVSGIIEGTGIYFSFLSSIFSNLLTITSHAIKMDWVEEPVGNQSSEK
jgi:hypothetical protein